MAATINEPESSHFERTINWKGAIPIANSRMFRDAMGKHAVPCELLELPSGGHGLNGYKGPMWDAWQGASLKWMEARGYLPEED